MVPFQNVGGVNVKLTSAIPISFGIGFLANADNFSDSGVIGLLSVHE